MKVRNILALAVCSATLALPAASQAHFLWLSVDPVARKASVAFQEAPELEPLPLGARAPLVTAWLASGRKLKLDVDGTWFRASLDAPCVAASLDYGVIDRRDAGRGVFWLKYYAKGAASLAASQTRVNLPIELSAVESDGVPIVTVWRAGKPAADADIVVEDASGKPTFQGKTGADGTAALPRSDGPLEVRALITDNTPGSLDGKPYELIRAYSTLTVHDTSAKSLRVQLRASFGDLHDVVSHTAFIITVMDGHLTKAQLADHLQQRALIHEAVDRILKRARVRPLPYGESQEEVLSLLRSDLRAMGTPWPAPADAWPLTSKLLDDIRASAKTGPYFALGVFYVYYGGITHGGRDIGAMILQQTKVDLTYYEKSDGYDAFAPQVDQITDPQAQAEMIRGALEAYHYIIDVNNLDVFKTSNL